MAYWRKKRERERKETMRIFVFVFPLSPFVLFRRVFRFCVSFFAFWENISETVARCDIFIPNRKFNGLPHRNWCDQPREKSRQERLRPPGRELRASRQEPRGSLGGRGGCSRQSFPFDNSAPCKGPKRVLWSKGGKQQQRSERGKFARIRTIAHRNCDKLKWCTFNWLMSSLFVFNLGLYAQLVQL